MEREARHAPSAAGGHGLARLNGDDERGLTEVIDQPAGDDPDHAGMPARCPNHHRGVTGELPLDDLLGLLRDSSFQGLTLRVLGFQELGEFGGLARRGRRQEFDRQPRKAKTPGSVESRRKLEADILGGDRAIGLDPRGLQQGAHADRWLRADAFEAVLDEDAVLIAKGDDISHQPESGKANGVEEKFAQFWQHLVGTADALGQRQASLSATPAPESVGESDNSTPAGGDGRSWPPRAITDHPGRASSRGDR